MGGAASRGVKAAPAVARRAPTLAPHEVAAVQQGGHAAGGASAVLAQAAPHAAAPQRDAVSKDDSLESMMLQLGGAIKGRALDEHSKQARAPIPRILARRTAEHAGRLRVEDVRETYRRHRDGGASAGELAAAYGVDATLLSRALHAARLPRIFEVPLGNPPVLRRVAADE